MATFDVISAPSDLPSFGARESPTLDFKGALDRIKGTSKVDYFELAKDVASMASVYGGTLLIGAQGGSELVRYEALSEVAAKEACEAYQVAGRDRCVPPPLIVPEKIPYETGYVVAVNVFAVLDRPVGVWVTPVADDYFGSPPRAYVFPVRLSTHAIPYSPENLPMLLNPAVRRAAILVESIPEAARQTVRFAWTYWSDSQGRAFLTQRDLRVLGVDISLNVIRTADAQDPNQKVNVPLDDVAAVWQEASGRWAIRVHGEFALDPLTYVPPRNR